MSEALFALDRQKENVQVLARIKHVEYVWDFAFIKQDLEAYEQLKVDGNRFLYLNSKIEDLTDEEFKEYIALMLKIRKQVAPNE